MAQAVQVVSVAQWVVSRNTLCHAVLRYATFYLCSLVLCYVMIHCSGEQHLVDTLEGGVRLAQREHERLLERGRHLREIAQLRLLRDADGNRKHGEGVAWPGWAASMNERTPWE